MISCRGSEGFPPSCRLRRRGEFQRVQQRGRRFAGAHFVVFSQLRSQEVSRLGITVSRRVGNAVVRNRLKRLVREFFRRRTKCQPPHDTVVIARPGAGMLTFHQVESELEALFAKAIRGSQSSS